MVTLPGLGWLYLPLYRLRERYRRVRAIPISRVRRAMRPDDFHALCGVGVGFVPGRVVLVCGSLAPGGAERQVVYTMFGLANRRLESVQLLCDFLTPGHPNRYDFYLPQLSAAGVPVRTIRSRSARQRLPHALAAAAHVLPAELVEDIANLYWEFVALRPEVVHAWLDWCNIRAGFAAALAGVPKIIISGRNLNPTHFALYLSYMDPGYKALCTFPNVTFLNNSHAGAVDYADWLEIPRERIQVIHNGVDFGKAGRAAPEQIEAWRRRLEIPEDAPVVGGVFRFYPEKRPLLWVETAARIAALCPNAYFVVHGMGILREQIGVEAKRLGIADRLRLPGVTEDVLGAMSAMDVFLLTSSGEGIPNVVLEAQWVGTPVVATNAGGTPETVDDGVTGWIVDSPDADLLARQVTRVLADDAARRRCLLSGPAFVRRRFGVERMIAKTLAAYGYPLSDAAPARIAPLVDAAGIESMPVDPSTIVGQSPIDLSPSP